LLNTSNAVKKSTRFIAIFLLSICLTQWAWAQFNVSGPGFLPDENGTNPDQPQVGKGAPSVTAGAIIKDCAYCPEMVVIPAGSFVMGSNKSSDEQPAHSVNLRSFLMGKTEVTQEQLKDVRGYNFSRFSACGPNCPAENVSWIDVEHFIVRLNQKTGQKYRLPSEAEWEYAARAGTTTEWSYGSDQSKLGDYAWHSSNSRGGTQAVGQKLPNAFGLFDMHGNVWEWTQDCWHNNYVGAPTNGSAWTTVCTDYDRVLRGGSWFSNPAGLRSASRDRYFPLKGDGGIGFRLARDL